MLDREVFSCIPFQLFFVPNLLVFVLCEKNFPFAKNFFGTEVWILRSKFFFREQLVLYTGFICSATSVGIVFWQLLPYQIPFNQSNWFSDFGMSVITFCLTYLQKLWRYVDIRNKFRDKKRSSVKHSGELWSRVSNSFPDLLYDIVALWYHRNTLWLRTLFV